MRIDETDTFSESKLSEIKSKLMFKYFLIVFEDINTKLAKEIDRLNNSLTTLKKSNDIKKLYYLIMKTANFMNKSKNKPKIEAFKVDTLLEIFECGPRITENISKQTIKNNKSTTKKNNEHTNESKAADEIQNKSSSTENKKPQKLIDIFSDFISFPTLYSELKSCDFGASMETINILWFEIYPIYLELNFTINEVKEFDEKINKLSKNIQDIEEYFGEKYDVKFANTMKKFTSRLRRYLDAKEIKS